MMWKVKISKWTYTIVNDVRLLGKESCSLTAWLVFWWIYAIKIHKSLHFWQPSMSSLQLKKKKKNKKK